MKPNRISTRTAAGVAILVGMSACVDVAMVELALESGSGKYTKIIRDFDARGGYAALDGSDISYSQLGTVCTAYFEIRDNAKYSDCAKRFLAIPVPQAWAGLAAKEDFAATELRREAIIDLELGNFEKAYQSASKSQRAVENTEFDEYLNHKFDLLRAYRVAGVAAALTEREGEARTLASKALKVHSDTVSDDEALVQPRRYAAAGVYTALKDYPKVIWVFEEGGEPETTVDFDRVMGAMATFGMTELIDPLLDEATADWSQRERIPLSYMYGRALLETGQIDKARAAFDQILAAPVVVNFGSIYYSLLADRARVAVADGDSSAAIGYLRRAVVEIERRRKTLNTETSKIGFVGDKQVAYADLISLLIQSGQPEQAFEYAERAKARALVDLLASRDDLVDGNQDNPQTAQLIRAISDAEADEVSTNSPVSRSLDGAKQRLSAAAPELASLVTVSSESASEIQARLGSDEQLLEYYYEPISETLVAFVVTRTSIKVRQLDPAGIGEAVFGFVGSVQDPRDTGWQSASEALYAKLIEPVANDLKGNRLLVVPHSALHYVPFAALHSGTDFLGETYSIRMLPSASVLGFLDKRVEDRNAMLAYGNPEFGDSAVPLPGAEAEARAIASLWTGADLLTGTAATETQLKNSAGNFGIIHLATHGEFNAAEPLASRIVLARDGENDGSLTIPEIYNLRLNADLVTLSACETALGKIANGDDVIGLNRGFMFAGANSIVSSLWQVPDQQTSDLMTAFYTGLKAGDPKALALQNAQKKVRQAYEHPFYWAAFQVTGAS